MCLPEATNAICVSLYILFIITLELRLLIDVVAAMIDVIIF